MWVLGLTVKDKDMQELKLWAFSVVIRHGYIVGIGSPDALAKYTLVRGKETVYLADVEKLVEFASRLEPMPVVMSA